MNETEKRFEEFIESYLVSENGGWTKATDAGYCSDESKDKERKKERNPKV